MRTASIYSAFNARWLEPEAVARSFVPTTHFKALVRPQNSLLMGPRGCGKTTLLKMLTRRAQRTWVTERLPLEDETLDYRSPDFEAIYIASDIRWSSELGSLPQTLADPKLAELLQRCLVSISALIECTRAFEELLKEKDMDPLDFAKRFIDQFRLGPTLPFFAEIRVRLRDWIEELQAYLVKGDDIGLAQIISRHHPSLIGHALAAATKACSIIDEFTGGQAPTRWALCFDEIEIAPPWLQAELFRALRSFDQRFLLKITWSPLLPTELTLTQERQHDFAAIRMWHGHVNDARPFCKEFTTRYVRDKLEQANLLPKDVFGSSLFSQEDTEIFESYGKGSAIWSVMRRLAKHDDTFREYLNQQGISPDNPTAVDIAVRDESLRKAKPIVILRDAYRGVDGQRRVVRRSRKNVSIFYGEDAIYSMSEGNPRLLAGLLNDLFDAETSHTNQSLPMKLDVQSRVLSAAAQRTLSGIKAYPMQGYRHKRSLADLVELIGHYLHDELVFGDFSVDPAGGFFVDSDTPIAVTEDIKLGLLIGAFVHVKTKDADIPSSVIGARFRLSYMLSPHFGLPFRNNRALRLSTALRVSAAGQRSMFQFSEGQ